MILKTVIMADNGSSEDKYFALNCDFTLTRPDRQGNFDDQWFTHKPDECAVREPIPECTVAIVHNKGNMNPIYIHKDQGAYLIGQDGKTISVVNKLPALVIWYRSKLTIIWKKLEKSSEKIAWHRVESFKEDSEYEFLELKSSIDPNDCLTQDKTMITWVLNNQGTSKTWRPCSQLEYEMNRYNPNYGFKQCSPGEDPNRIKQEWLK